MRLDLTGQEFGQWTVLRAYTSVLRVVNGATFQTPLWECVCSCGATSLIPGNALRRGRSTRCRGCASRVAAKKLRTPEQLLAQWERTREGNRLRKARQRAKMSGPTWSASKRSKTAEALGET